MLEGHRGLIAEYRRKCRWLSYQTKIMYGRFYAQLRIKMGILQQPHWCLVSMKGLVKGGREPTTLKQVCACSVLCNRCCVGWRHDRERKDSNVATTARPAAHTIRQHDWPVLRAEHQKSKVFRAIIHNQTQSMASWRKLMCNAPLQGLGCAAFRSDLPCGGPTTHSVWNGFEYGCLLLSKCAYSCWSHCECAPG